MTLFIFHLKHFKLRKINCDSVRLLFITNVAIGCCSSNVRI